MLFWILDILVTVKVGQLNKLKVLVVLAVVTVIATLELKLTA